MIDRVLKQGVGGNQESYYFQLIPISLSLINTECELPVHGTTYRFAISKGQQKFDQNKIPIQANFQSAGNLPVLVISSCRLNFYIPSYFKQRKQEFVLSMVQRQNNEDYDLGQYKINVDDLITKFKENNMIRHQIKSKFTDDYELDFEIYIEKNRMALQKHIRQNKVQRINKSPLRQRSMDKGETPKREFNNSSKKSPTNNVNEKIAPSRDREQKKITPQVSQPKQEYTQTIELTQEIHVDPTPEPVCVMEVQIPRQQNTGEANQAVKEVSQKRGYNASQKNEITSQKSKDKVPLIQTKYKPLKYEGDGQPEVKMKDSQRLGNTIPQEAVNQKTSSDQTSIKQKIYLSLFLIISMVIMYFAMHPNRKV